MSPSVKPFNEAKYKALMDGLECSEIRFNEIHNWNPIFRIDKVDVASDRRRHENVG